MRNSYARSQKLLLKLSLSASALLLIATANVFAQSTGSATTRSARERPVQPPVGAPASLPAKNPPLSGTLGPDAARALRAGADQRPGSIPLGIGASTLGPSKRRGLGVGGYVPLSVVDAPAYGRGSSTLVVQPLSPPQVTAPAFYPTAEPPRWRVVAEEHPVQAWRLVDVEDTVCDPAGACSRVRTRMQARWMPALGGYAFRDRVGRIWRVE